MNKLYIVCRGDIPAGAQIAQTAHALAAFATAHPDRFKSWAEPEQRNIVCLAAPSRGALEALLASLLAQGIACAAFRETDLNDELTGFSCGEEAGKSLSCLPLAGRDPLRPTKAAPNGYVRVPFEP
jgi:hypothetical protein